MLDTSGGSGTAARYRVHQNMQRTQLACVRAELLSQPLSDGPLGGHPKETEIPYVCGAQSATKTCLKPLKWDSIELRDRMFIVAG